MNLRSLTFIIKSVILVMMLFSGIEVVIQLSGVLIVLTLLPKIQTMIDLVLHSGYFISPAGIIFKVEKEDRDLAIGQGCRELSLLKSSVMGKYVVWKSEG